MTVNADGWTEPVKQTGRVSVYGINFATGNPRSPTAHFLRDLSTRKVSMANRSHRAAANPTNPRQKPAAVETGQTSTQIPPALGVGQGTVVRAVSSLFQKSSCLSERSWPKRPTA